jgi:ribonucleases P/MRP protein subunit RPP40
MRTDLKKTGLITLEKRRVRGDLIQVFKIIKGLDKLDFNMFFELSTNARTRGHSLKLVKKFCKGDHRKYFFSQRVVNIWNGLPHDVVAADTVNCFKNRLDRFNRYF